MTTADHVAIPPNVVVRSFVDETVLMDLESWQYFSLDRIGGAMLDELLERTTIQGAARELSRAGWGDKSAVEHELLDLCRELEPLGLLRVDLAA